jgi:hypothetical protein
VTCWAGVLSTATVTATGRDEDGATWPRTDGRPRQATDPDVGGRGAQSLQARGQRTDPAGIVLRMGAWVPIRCPVAGCGYDTTMRLMSGDENSRGVSEKEDILRDEHPNHRHPGEPDGGAE